MSCDLNTLIADLYRRFVESGRDNFYIDSAGFELPDSLSTDQLIVLNGFRSYAPSVLVDMAIFKANKDTYTKLGLFIFGFIFDPDKRKIEIRLTNNESNVKIINIEKTISKLKPKPGLTKIPLCFLYFESDIERYPLSNKNSMDVEYPELTFESPFSGFEKNHSRDVINGLGSIDGASKFAEVLLNFGSERNHLVEIQLESPLGNGGVSSRSAEILLLLPGSDWD